MTQAQLPGIAKAPKISQDRIAAWFKEGIAAGDAKLENGWVFTIKTGLYGTNYIQRATVTWYGLGANRPQDAVYPTSEGPKIVEKYNGANKYVLHFDKGQTPPVDGFWSVTMYNAQYFFVANPINRYSISARNSLKSNADGSTDLYIQADSPGKAKEANWLPAPKDDFVLMMRLYWPKEKNPSILDGRGNTRSEESQLTANRVEARNSPPFPSFPNRPISRTSRNLPYSQRKTFAESAVQTTNTSARAATSP